MSTQVADLVGRLRMDASGFVSGGVAAERTLSSLEARHKQVAAGLSQTGSTLSRYVSLPLAAAGAAAAKLSIDWGSAFAKMEGLAALPRDQVKGLQHDVLGLAGATAQAPQDLANAMYFIVSGGIAASKATEVLTASARAATAGLGDVATVSQAVVSAVNAFANQNLTAAQATDVMVATTRAATFEADALAGSMGRVLPIAAQMGVGFDQVGGALAALSQGGLDANHSTTALLGILNQILRPTGQGALLWQQMFGSLDNVRAVLKDKGLLGLLQEMSQKVEGNQAAIAELFPDVRGLVGALSLLGQDPAKVANIFEQTANAAGSTDSAFKAMAKTAGFDVAQALAETKIALIGLGATAAPAIRFLAEGIAHMASFIDGLPGPVKTVALAVGTLLAVAGPLFLLAGAGARAWIGLTAVFGGAAAATGAETVAMAAATAATTTEAAATAAATEQLALFDVTMIGVTEQLALFDASAVGAAASTEAIGAGAAGSAAGLGPLGLAIAGITAALVVLHLTSKDGGGPGSWLSGLTSHIPQPGGGMFGNVMGGGPKFDTANEKAGMEFAQSASVAAESAAKLNDTIGANGVAALRAYELAMMGGAQGADRYAGAVERSGNQTSSQSSKFVVMTEGIDRAVNAMGPAEKASLRLALAQKQYADDIQSGNAPRSRLLADQREIATANVDVKRIQDAVNAAMNNGATATSSQAGATGRAAGAQSAFQRAMNASGQALDEVTMKAGSQAASALEAMGISGAWAAQTIQAGMSAAAIAVSGLLASIQAGLDAESATTSLGSALQGLSDAERGVGSSAGGMGGAHKSAAAAALDAEQKHLSYRDALRGLEDAQVAVAAAALDQQRAIEDVSSAERAQRRASEDMAAALIDEAAARKHLNDLLHGSSGGDDAASARKGARDSLLRLQEAQVGLTRAQQKLTDVSKNHASTTADVQEAQLALRRAQFDVTDATNAHNAAVKLLDETLHGFSRTSDEAKQAQEELRQAHRRVEDAQDSLRSSTRGVQDAYIAVSDKARALRAAQDAVTTADYNVRRSLADLKGQLDSTGGAAKAFHSRAQEVKTAVDQAKTSVFNWAQKQADATGAVRGTDEWTRAFYTSLVNLKTLVHPTGELARFMDDMIKKFDLLLHPVQPRTVSSLPPPGSAKGAHARGTIATQATFGLFGEAGPEAIVPLGSDLQARQDRYRIMSQAMRIAPDLGGTVGPSGGGGSYIRGGSDGGVIVEEMHNHFLHSDRDLLNRIANMSRATGRKIVTKS